MRFIESPCLLAAHWTGNTFSIGLASKLEGVPRARPARGIGQLPNSQVVPWCRTNPNLACYQPCIKINMYQDPLTLFNILQHPYIYKHPSTTFLRCTMFEILDAYHRASPLPATEKKWSNLEHRRANTNICTCIPHPPSMTDSTDENVISTQPPAPFDQGAKGPRELATGTKNGSGMRSIICRTGWLVRIARHWSTKMPRQPNLARIVTMFIKCRS